MNIKYPLLIPVIGHGATNIIDFPIQTISYNLFSALIIYKLNLIQRQVLLVFFSIFHLSQDIPNKIKFNSQIFNMQNKKILIASLFHKIMIKKPIIAKLYFLIIHSPLHYLRILNSKIKVKEKLGIGVLTSILSIFFINKDYDIFLENKMGKLWWIFPILPHILLTYKFDKKLNKKIK